MENIQMFNVGIARLLEPCERGEALGWRRARLGGPPGAAPRDRAGAAGRGRHRAGSAAPRAARRPRLSLFTGAPRLAGTLRGSSGARGRLLPPLRAALGAPRSRRPEPGAGAAPGALPQLRRAGAAELARPARGSAAARLGDESARDSGKFGSPPVRRGERPVPRGSAGSPRPLRAGAPHRTAPRVVPVRWRRMFPDPCRAERALTTKGLRFLLFSRGLVRM